jgi:hypothetical protein
VTWCYALKTRLYLGSKVIRQQRRESGLQDRRGESSFSVRPGVSLAFGVLK